MYSSGSTSLRSNVTWTGSYSTSHSWRQNTRDTGLPNSEDRIALHSLILTQYRSVTDGQTDSSAVAKIIQRLQS